MTLWAQVSSLGSRDRAYPLVDCVHPQFKDFAKKGYGFAFFPEITKAALSLGGNIDCTMIAAAPILPVGYVVSASRIADRWVILAGYRLTDLLTRLTQY